MIIFATCNKCKTKNYYPIGFYRGNNQKIIYWICKECNLENIINKREV